MKVSSLPPAVAALLLCVLALAVPQTGRSQCCPPIITTQPTNQSSWLGSNITLSVVVSSATTPSYTWHLYGTNIVATNVVGITSSNLTILNAQYTNAGVYSCGITNSAGGVVSANATITLDGPPQIITQPTGKTVTETGNTTFSVVAGGTNLTYQWRFYTTNNLAGETSANFNLNNAQAWQAGNYSVLVENPYGAVTSVSVSATVTLPVGVVACWGNTSAPASTVYPPTRGGYIALAAGGFHSMGLRTNGTVVAWGDNSFGQTNVPPGLTNVEAIAAGYSHSMALRQDNTVIVWGDNSAGQTNVPPGLIKVSAISAGSNHCVALRNDGTVICWGSNLYGESAPPPGLKDVVRIAAGYHHNLALRRDGSIVVWGRTNSGEAIIPTNLTGVVSIAAGDGFNLALRTNGAVVAWGDNSWGQTNIPAGNNIVAAIAAGGYHALALREAGTLMSWGRNAEAQTNLPFILTAGNANLNAIAAGGYHNLALKGTAAPTITSQPWDLNVNPGNSATFAVLATGAGTMTYYWQFNGSNVLSGSNRKQFAITNAQLNNVGPYYVIVTNSSGMATSSIAFLSVNTFYLTALGHVPGGFAIRLNGAPGTYVIQSSSNLTFWNDALTTNIPGSGFLDLVDPNPSPYGRRFYRARLP